MSIILPITSPSIKQSESTATSVQVSSTDKAKDSSFPFIPGFSPQEKLMRNLYRWGITNEWGDPMPEYADILLPKVVSNDVHAWLDAPYAIIARDNLFVVQTTLRQYLTQLRIVFAQHPSFACTNLEICGDALASSLRWNHFEQVFTSILDRYNQKADKPLNFNEMFPLELMASLRQELSNSFGIGKFRYCMDKAIPNEYVQIKTLILEHTARLLQGTFPSHIIEEFALTQSGQREELELQGFCYPGTDQETRMDLSFNINNPRRYFARHDNLSLPCLECLEDLHVKKEFSLIPKDGKGLSFFLDRLMKILDVHEPEKMPRGGIGLLACIFKGFQVYKNSSDRIILENELNQKNNGLPPFHFLKTLWESTLQTHPINDPWDYLISPFLLCQSLQNITTHVMLGAYLDLVLMHCLSQVANETPSPGLQLLRTAVKLLTRRCMTFDGLQAFLLIGGLASVIKPSSHSSSMIRFGLTRFRGLPALSAAFIGQKEYKLIIPIDLPEAFTKLRKLKKFEGEDLTLFQNFCEGFFQIPFEPDCLESPFTLPYQQVSLNIASTKDSCIELLKQPNESIQEIAYSLYLSLGFIEDQLTDKRRLLNTTLQMLTQCQKPKLREDWIQGLENLFLKHRLTPIPSTMKQTDVTQKDFYRSWSRFLLSNRDEEMQSQVLSIWDKLDREDQVKLAQEIIPVWIKNFPGLINSLWKRVCKLDDLSIEASFFLRMETHQFKPIFDQEVALRAQELGVDGDPLLYVLFLLSRAEEEKYVTPLTRILRDNIANCNPSNRAKLLTEGYDVLSRKELWDDAACLIIASDQWIFHS